MGEWEAELLVTWNRRRPWLWEESSGKQQNCRPNFGAELCGRIVPDLQELLLSGNNIGPAGAQALAEGSFEELGILLRP